MLVQPLAAPTSPSAAARALAGRPGLAVLDGDGVGDAGRWSFVASDPVEVRRAGYGSRAPLAALPDDGPLEIASNESPSPIPPSRIPRWIGAIAYDAAFDGLLPLSPRMPRRARAPIAYWARYDALAAFDLKQGTAFAVGDDPGAVRALRSRLSRPETTPLVEEVSEVIVEAPKAHLEAIERALHHIARGDIYQVNLARRFGATYVGHPLALFEAMRAASPVPRGFYLDLGSSAICGRSMELFSRWDRRSGRIHTRPIKGTVERRETQSEEALDALPRDPKERAEHAMIVDLMRNDLGRIAEVGTVKVVEPMVVEPYRGLAHLVSTVECVAREGLGLADIVAATFPPGSVTGAPKIRAVEIIENLERHPRGMYCGAVGHVDRCGGLTLAVAIRTAVVDRARRCVEYFAGGGLVSASVPERELAETELKAEVFLEALAATRKGLPHSPKRVM